MRGILRPPRPGYTLLELLVSSVSATFLIAGLASALFVAGSALDGRPTAAERGRAAEAQSTVLADLEHAISFSERTADAVTFTVPDRNGDAVAETLRYTWGGSSNGELALSINGGAPATVLTGVKSFRLDWFSRFVQPEHATPPALDPTSWGKRW
jgi:hypothetical protein